MQLLQILHFFLLTIGALASVLPERAADRRGSYSVNGLGTRKKAILTAGGNTLDLAIAMLETDDMKTDYPFGAYPPMTCVNSLALNAKAATGDKKSGDSANFGVFKQNWRMIRACAKRAGLQGQGPSQYKNGAKLK